LAKVSLELGGKNPLLVCDDANLDEAVKWTCLSAYSNAGQRCASASRIIVFDAVYDAFRDRLMAATDAQKVGSNDDDDFGPVINERQLTRMVAAVAKAKSAGARILVGGALLDGAKHKGGYYMAATLIDDIEPDDELSTTELFGPIACLYRVPGYDQALALANRSPYGLTAAIHTRNVHRAMHFVQSVEAGVAVVNAGTFGSEPHMPFGGVKQSGNSTREPGTEALDVYSELKNVYWIVDPEQV
jgi:aldehyde dehydrogenase (NAD+)